MPTSQIPPPSRELLLQARIAFIQQGSSMNRWMLENNIDRSYGTKSMNGDLRTPGADALRARILVGAGLLPATAAAPRRRKQSCKS